MKYCFCDIKSATYNDIGLIKCQYCMCVVRGEGRDHIDRGACLCFIIHPLLMCMVLPISC